MPVSCAAYNCTNRFRKGSGITFHSFPLKNKDLLAKWIIAMRRKDWMPTSSERLCSEHFDPSLFRLCNDRRYLKENSVPSVFVFPEHLKIRQQNSRRPLTRVNAMQSSQEDEDINQPSEVISNSAENCENNPVCNPPRKVRVLEGENVALKRKLKLAQQKIRRRNSNILRLRKTITELEQLICPSAVPMFRNVFSDALKELLEQSEPKYSEQTKKFALTLHFYSAKAYDFLRTHLKLPHPSTLRRWSSFIDGRPGFTEQAFHQLQLEVEKGPLYCCLMFDEMSVKKGVDWNGNETIGYVDLGHGYLDCDDTDAVCATQSLVFMIAAVNRSWKLPIGYCLIDSVSAIIRANLVILYLQKLHEVGVKCVAVTCDGLSANVTMFKELGIPFEENVVPERSWFQHLSDRIAKVYAFLDAARMLKLARNLLGEHSVLTYKSDEFSFKIEWQYIAKLAKLQEDEGLTAANKLGKHHWQWQQQKMKVRLAGETLSQSVADGLSFCSELDLEGFEGSAPTVRYIATINNVFDLLNSCHPMEKFSKSPVRKSNEEKIRNRIEDGISFLSSLCDKEGKPILSGKRKTPILGLILNLLSVRGISEDLVWVDDPPLKFLLTKKFSQDHLELFFSTIRSRGGFSNNPTALEFRGAYRKCLVAKIQPSVLGNCRPDETNVLNLVSASNVSMEKKISNSIEFSSSQVPDSLSLYCENVVSYMAGWVVKKFREGKGNCPQCIDIVLLSTDTVHSSLISLKNNGGLIYPSKDVVSVCRVAETCYRGSCSLSKLPSTRVLQVLKISILHKLLDMNIMRCNEHLFTAVEFGDESHYSILIKKLLDIYFNVRMHFIGKKQSLDLRGKNVRQTLTKLITFKGQ